nr:hypothetical protein [Gilliamella apicola]
MGRIKFMKKNICVFCGANDGSHFEYRTQAELLGKTLAEQNRRLIYGGGNKGLMGVIANSVLEHGGKVIGIIPKLLVEAETAHHGITRLEVVDICINERQDLQSLLIALLPCQVEQAH